MELIKILDKRFSKNGKYLESWALFLCSYCLQEVERRLKNGKLAKSCGCNRFNLSEEQRRKIKKLWCKYGKEFIY